MNWEYATLIFLAAVFVAAEVFRARRGVRGTIVAVEDDRLGPVPLPVMRVRVRLQGGQEVTAGLNCCTACLGRLMVGDEVRVTDTADGYTADLPWLLRRKSCNGPIYGRMQDTETRCG